MAELERTNQSQALALTVTITTAQPYIPSFTLEYMLYH